MALKLNVPSLSDDAAAEDIKRTIKTTEPDAQVEINIDAKTVTVESGASEETIKQLITATGHRIAE
jgi:copper chaperone